ncbi:hypothetical protein COW64_16300 [bacterium (Candidatus Blackallbacteria) CG18_big_fil_WC_8_21_14_2_50_49_26]|nr:MAG: hypothetical protein COW64_16300 [bacterium (Candidatus Blackallbacteria) CG18_big_fil_WC_8_21_14_2_50_49_26]
MKSEHIGKRLSLWRNSLGITQEKFSQQIGMQIGVYRKYEQGKNVPGGEALESISNTGVNIVWLLTGEGSMKYIDPINERLKLFRNYFGYTQQRFGELIGISTEDIILYETGKKKITQQILEKVSLLGANLNWLISGDGEISSYQRPKRLILPDELEPFRNKFIELFDLLTQISEKKRDHIIDDLLFKARDSKIIDELEKIIHDIKHL